MENKSLALRAAETRFQIYLAATVPNLTLLTGESGLDGDPDPEFPMSTTHADSYATGARLRSTGRTSLSGRNGRRSAAR